MMEEVINLIQSPSSILRIDSSFVEIKTGLEFKKGIPVKIYVKKEGDKIFLTDNKNTLRFMNTTYELTARDVKKCITDIANHYHFTIERGEIKAEISSVNAKKRYFELLTCCLTLANMFIFFDEPEEN